MKDGVKAIVAMTLQQLVAELSEHLVNSYNDPELIIRHVSFELVNGESFVFNYEPDQATN